MLCLKGSVDGKAPIKGCIEIFGRKVEKYSEVRYRNIQKKSIEIFVR